MRWLIHGKCSPAVAELLRKREDIAQTPIESDIDGDQPSSILKQAHVKQLDVVTIDAEFVSHAIAHGGFGRSLVYLQVEGGDLEQDDALTRLFKRYKRLTPGRLYTVTASRVKIRQLPKT